MATGVEACAVVELSVASRSVFSLSSSAASKRSASSRDLDIFGSSAVSLPPDFVLAFCLFFNPFLAPDALIGRGRGAAAETDAGPTTPPNRLSSSDLES